jgi:hypothetical protein
MYKINYCCLKYEDLKCFGFFFLQNDKDLSTAALRKEWLKERDELRLLYNVVNNLI